MMAGHRLILPFTLVRPMILTGSIPSLLSDQPIDHSPDSLSAFAGINRFPLCQERRNSSDHSAILFATTFPCDIVIVLAQHALRPHPLIITSCFRMLCGNRTSATARSVGHTRRSGKQSPAPLLLNGSTSLLIVALPDKPHCTGLCRCCLPAS